MNQRGKPPAGTVIALALIVILGIVTIVAAVTVLQLPDPVTEEGRRTDNLYQPVLAISLVVFFGVTAGIIWAIFRYKRESDYDEMPVQVHGSNILETTWTVIPVLILVLLFIPALILLIDLKNPPDDEDVDVRVSAVGHQWWWEFQYPDDGVVVQELPPNYDNVGDAPPTLVLPVDATIVVDITSTDVVHSFGVPRTLYKLHAVPGVINTMHMRFEETGVFTGQCYQFCGVRHADMLFLVDVREQDEYEAWLSETQAEQGVDPDSLAAKED